MRSILFLIIILTLLLASCTAERPVQVMEVWARPGNTGGTTAVYMTIQNPDSEAEELLNASTDAAEFVELHMSMMGPGDMMTMEEQESIEIPGRSTVELAPGGLHVMLINLLVELQPGDTITMGLYFLRAGEMEFTVEVREP
jgi:periplasmic copper chaperone A